MTALSRVVNSRGHYTIDRERDGYGYIGKYALPGGIGTTTFPCKGFPLVFFSIPYNQTDPGSAAVKNVYSSSVRPGVALVGVKNNGDGTWTATTISIGPVSMPTQYLRVFGKVSMNWPSGSGRVPNLKLRSDAGELHFDAGVRMLKLAGDTYDMELTLDHNVPGWEEAVNKYDRSYTVPFDLNNKSIAAACRCTIGMPYDYGSYIDWDSGQSYTQWHMPYYDTLYAGSGTSLQVKRCITENDPDFETTGFYSVGASGIVTYSRLAVIDNTKFP
jgi:hypothetical protein